ncbi:MAG: hypothetical protein ACREEM_23285 [Blastocatellia bacterium]
MLNTNRRLSLLRPSLICAIAFAIAGASGLAFQKKEKPVQPGKPVIWQDPGEIEKLDFVGGPGGSERAPKRPFTFVEERLTGSNPKIRVTDANGAKWNVKFGSEVNAETFATRLIWACGYFVDPAYFVPSGKVEQLGKLSRAKKAVSSDGQFTDARFEAVKEKGVRELDAEQSWGWVSNSFVGSKELNGLKVLMMLTSNWDNKDVRDTSRGSNTAIYQTPTQAGLEDRYIVTDWGGSMGKWGGVMSREKWDCKGYSSQTKDFVKGMKGDQVEFGYSGQHSESFKTGIRKSDVQWLMQYLGRITDNQLRAGLQASGATSEEVECFTRSIRERINQLKAIR